MKPSVADINLAMKLIGDMGFRRRCGWCGVQLRGWQLNLCRLCYAPATGSAGIYLSAGGPSCGQGSRWDAEPDHVRAVPKPMDAGKES